MGETENEQVSAEPWPSLVKYNNASVVTTKDSPKDKKTGKRPSQVEQQRPSVLQTEDVLDSLLPPRIWSDKGVKYIQHVSSAPATRLDVVNLQAKLDQELQRRQARETGICPIREELYAQESLHILPDYTEHRAIASIVVSSIASPVASPQSSAHLSSFTFSKPQHRTAREPSVVMVKEKGTAQESSFSGKDTATKAAGFINKDTNTATVNDRELQLTPAIVEHIFKIPNDPTPKACSAEEISIYLKEKPVPKEKWKAAGQGITVNDLSYHQKAYRFAVETVGLKNCSTYISEKMYGILLARLQSPDAPIDLVNFLISNVVQQTAKFPHMGLYKAGYVWQYLYYATASENQKPQVPLTLTEAGEPEEPAENIGTGKRLLEVPVGEPGVKRSKLTNKPLAPLKELVPLEKKDPSITIHDSQAKSPSSHSSTSHHDRSAPTQLMIKKDKLQAMQKHSVKGKFIMDNSVNLALTYTPPVSRFLLENDTCFDELIRQVTVNCAERGLLLLRVRDELRMTIAAYQTLYESSVAFGLRKALQAECGKANMEARIQQMDTEIKELDRQVADWKNKCDLIEKRESERKAYEDKKRAEEIAYYTKSNKQLKTQLEAFLAPAKK
ncbi:hypothetical protein L7F22_040161 [Adiantum nelumboides]|nr:hypothetical protein [Adiantum nelumboides]